MSVDLKFTHFITQQVKFTTQNSVLQKEPVKQNYDHKYKLQSLVCHEKDITFCAHILEQQLDTVIFNISGTAIKLETCNAIQKEPAALL